MTTLLITLALLMQAPTDSLPDLSHPWTLQECMDWALEHNLTVATQTITRERTAVEKNTAEWSWVPDASGSVSQNWNFGRGLGGDNTYEYGNSANAEIVLEEVHDVLTLPESAIQYEGEQTFVYVAGADGYERREVETGLSDGVNIEIKRGLALDEKVRGPQIITTK